MVKEQVTPRKEAYYFSHDSNARNDEKILSMRMELGMEGYGIYWAIIEKMRENIDYQCSNDYKVIAFDLRVDETTVKKVVENYGLFIKSECGKKFYSQSLLNRMEKMNEKSEKARQSANARWKKKDKDATAMRTHNEGNALKESKGKENKGNTSIEYCKKEFVEDWNKLRTKHLKKPSHLPGLNREDESNFNELISYASKERIQEALIGLFKQKKWPNGNTQMASNPKHFLTHFNSYLSAFHDQNTNLYGEKETEKTL